jgi:2,5-dihydroxypyridine 5,6-dioxygenase
LNAEFQDLLKGAAAACQHSKVSKTETAVVYTDSAKDRTLVDAFLAAATLYAGEAVLVTTERRPPQTEPPAAAVEALANADVVFDATSNSWLYTKATSRIIGSGTRMLQVLVNAAGVVARPPDEAVIRRLGPAAKLLDNAKSLRVVSSIGTDLTIARGTRPTHGQAGFVDKPSTWDSFGTGMVNFSPPEDGANGMLVLNGTVHFSAHHDIVVNEPVRVRVESGRIVDVEQDGLDSRNVAAWLAEVGDPNMYTIAHVGFGLDHRSRIFGGDPMGWEGYLGGIILAFGANISPQLGGKNPARGHMDNVVHQHDLFIDGVKVIAAGKFTSASGLA